MYVGFLWIGANNVVACALLGNDDETLCNIARWFMKEYQFVTDGYRLFSALNRLCNSDNSWFNCGPSQKYILRQLKAVDFSLLGDSRRRTFFQERASYTTKDDDGNQIQAAELDVALLILYGHILHAGKSYAYAVSKFSLSVPQDEMFLTVRNVLKIITSALSLWIQGMLQLNYRWRWDTYTMRSSAKLIIDNIC